MTDVILIKINSMFDIFNLKNKKKQGFTLIELMVSIALFSVVIVIALGSLMMVINASRKAKTIKTIVNNLHVAIEGMSREIRVGYDYTSGATIGNLVDSDGGEDGNNNSIGFHTKKNRPGHETWGLYKLENGKIMRWINESAAGSDGRNDGGWLSITTDNITVNKLEFRVAGTDNNDDIQPRVMIIIEGTAKIEKFETEFNIQTTVSQRKLAP